MTCFLQYLPRKSSSKVKAKVRNDMLLYIFSFTLTCTINVLYHNEVSQTDEVIQANFLLLCYLRRDISSPNLSNYHYCAGQMSILWWFNGYNTGRVVHYALFYVPLNLHMHLMPCSWCINDYYDVHLPFSIEHTQKLEHWMQSSITPQVMYQKQNSRRHNSTVFTQRATLNNIFVKPVHTDFLSSLRWLTKLTS